MTAVSPADIEAAKLLGVIAMPELDFDERSDVDLIMAYELGDLEAEGVLVLFSRLIRSRQVWSMQGSYGRAAQNLIDAGHISPTGAIISTAVGFPCDDCGRTYGPCDPSVEHDVVRKEH